jgi:membrane protease subunit HflC
MKFGAIEASLTDQVDKAAQATYGVRVPFVRIRNLGLPDSPTRAVYDRMAAERGTEARQSRAEGVGLAGEIVARANSEAGQILAKAKADANRIMAEGDAEAARYYGEFAKNPELAIFLRQIEALKSILSQRSTIVLDPRTMPFNLLSENGVRIPVATKAERAAGVQVPNKAEVSVPARAEAETKVGG